MALINTCRAEGCHAPAGRGQFTVLCNRHHMAHRKTGHPQGTTITKGQLLPYRKEVRTKRIKTKDAAFWSKADERWSSFIHSIRGLANGTLGHAYVGYERRASALLCKVADHASAEEVLEVYSAMWLMQLRDPKRFRDDRHFRFTSVRRIEGLASSTEATRWDHKSNQVRRIRILPTPKVVEAAAKMLANVLGAEAVHVAKTLQEDARLRQQWVNKRFQSFDSIRTPEPQPQSA